MRRIALFLLGKSQSGLHIEFIASIGVDVLPDERRERTEVHWGETFRPFRAAEDLLHHEGVDVDEAVLKQVQGEHAEFVVFVAIAVSVG